MLDFFRKKLGPSPEKSVNIPAQIAFVMKPGYIHDDVRVEMKNLVDLVLASGEEGIKIFRQCLEDAFAMRANPFSGIWFPALDIAKQSGNPELFRTIEKVTRNSRDLVQGYPHPPHWMPEAETEIIGGGQFGWTDGTWKSIAHSGIEFLKENIPSLPPQILLEHRAAAFDTCIYHIRSHERIKNSGKYLSLESVEKEIAYWTAMMAYFQAGASPKQPKVTTPLGGTKAGIPFPGIITDIITDFEQNSLDIAVIVTPYDDYYRESMQRTRPDIRVFSFGGSQREQQRWAQFVSNPGGEGFSLADRNVIIAREGLVTEFREAQIFFNVLMGLQEKYLGFYLFYPYSRETYREFESLFSRSRSASSKLKINAYGGEGLLYSHHGRPDPSMKKATCGYMGLLTSSPDCEACAYRVECRGNKFRRS